MLLRNGDWLNAVLRLDLMGRVSKDMLSAVQGMLAEAGIASEVF